MSGNGQYDGDKTHIDAMLEPVYTKRQSQRCDNSVMTLVILFSLKNNGVTRKWVATPFLSDSIAFNESSITSVIAAMSLTLGVNGPINLDRYMKVEITYKQTLNVVQCCVMAYSHCRTRIPSRTRTRIPNPMGTL